MSVRLDKALVERKLVSTRHRAADMIASGLVMVNGSVVKKNAHPVAEADKIELAGEEMKWVGRGALKLLKAVEQWNIDCTGKTCLDVGASTGGFTQVLLEKGAEKVYAVDTGTAQLADVLKNDKRVVNLEKTNALHLTAEKIPDGVDLCVMDVSFVSSLKVVPGVLPFLKPGAEFILLVKPQFEAGKPALNKKGVVTDTERQQEAVEQVSAGLVKLGFTVKDHAESPVTGGDGNREFLMFLIFN